MGEHISAKMVQDFINSMEGMQRKVDALERKIDTLVKKSQPGMSGKGRSSRPHKKYDRSSRLVGGRPEEKKEEVSGERKFYDGRPFGKKKGGGKGGMKKGKKTFGKSFKGARGKH